MKYSTQQLEDMAMDFLYLCGMGDARVDVLIQTMCHYFRLPYEVVMSNIRTLARGEEL